MTKPKSFIGLVIVSGLLIFGLKLLAQGYNGRVYTPGYSGGNGRNYQAAASDALIDMHGGTNANAPTSTTMGNSVYGESGDITWSNSFGANMVFSNASQPVYLPVPAIIGGLAYTGNSGLGLKCTTNTSGTGCGSASATISNPTASVSVGFSIISSCPGTGDCGAQGGLDLPSVPDYAFLHLSPAANEGKIQLEGGGSSELSSQSYAYSANTLYRVNIQMNKGPSATHKMILCNSSNQFLAYFSVVGSSSASSNPNVLIVGTAGEEPTTSGYTYQFFNYAVRVGGAFSAGGPCF
jgi:hypothetical protein